uniref:Uncharacterized protein n=1 Tax=Globodera rostochiensis TaxID=31243 RepID=A0A914HVY9_GLORO
MRIQSEISLSLFFYAFFVLNVDGQNPAFASEFFPSSPGLLLPAAPTDPQKPKKTPTEEELIGKLLKSGAGLPPGPPADVPTEGENAGKKANSGEGQENIQHELEQSVQSPAAPPLPAKPENVDGQQKSERVVAAESPSMPSGAVGVVGSPSAPPTYVQCLLRIGPKVCDPENILNAEQKQQIDQTLTELKVATRKENAKDECDKSGLEAMFIIVKHSNLLDEQTSEVQKTLNQAMDMWVHDHPCEKPVVILLSTDPSVFNRKVWTGRHWDVPVDPGQLVQLFMDQGSLTLQQKYSLVIMNMIEGLLERYEKSIGK